jgi:hypothetical protein
MGRLLLMCLAMMMVEFVSTTTTSFVGMIGLLLIS